MSLTTWTEHKVFLINSWKSVLCNPILQQPRSLLTGLCLILCSLFHPTIKPQSGEKKKKNLEKFPCKYTGRLSHVLWLPDNGLGACSRVKGHSLKSNRFFPTASSRVLVSWLQGGGPRSWRRGAGGCRCCPPSSPSGASKDQATQNLCVWASAEEIEHLVPILCQPLRAGNRERTCLIMCFTLK